MKCPLDLDLDIFKGAIITKVAFGTNVRIMRPCDKYAGYGGGGRIKA